MKHLRALWAYRHFIVSSILTELKTRFIRSKLGGVWMIIHPLAQVAVYALVLSAVLSAKLPGIDSHYAYAIYLMAGILGWTLFAEILSRCVSVFVDNANLLKKVSFPKITLPLIIVGNALINHLLLLFSIIIVFTLMGHGLSFQILWLGVLTCNVIILALGMGLVLGILNVFIRDISQILPIVLQFWFWLTPIVYSWSIVPERYLPWVSLNPMSSTIQGYQNILVYHIAPDISKLLYPFALGIALLLLALFLYIKANEEMTDVL